MGREKEIKIQTFCIHTYTNTTTQRSKLTPRHLGSPFWMAVFSACCLSASLRVFGSSSTRTVRSLETDTAITCNEQQSTHCTHLANQITCSAELCREHWGSCRTFLHHICRLLVVYVPFNYIPTKCVDSRYFLFTTISWKKGKTMTHHHF